MPNALAQNAPSPRTLAKQYKMDRLRQPTLNAYDEAREIACLAVDVNYVRRSISAAAENTQAFRDVYSTSLTASWDIEELSAVVSPELRRDERPIYPGQKRASGRPLAPLPKQTYA